MQYSGRGEVLGIIMLKGIKMELITEALCGRLDYYREEAKQC